MSENTPTTTTEAAPILKRWKLDAGNTSTGCIGFVIYDIMAFSAEDALARVREELPEYIESKRHDNLGDQTITIVTYFNGDALTLDNIEEDEEEDEDDVATDGVGAQITAMGERIKRMATETPVSGDLLAPRCRHCGERNCGGHAK